MCGRYDNLIAREAYRICVGHRGCLRGIPPASISRLPTRSRSSASTPATEPVSWRWYAGGLVPGWSKEIPKVPHINARVRPFTPCGCSRKPSLSEEHSYRRRGSSSGRSEQTEGSPTGSSVRISNPSPLPGCGSSHGSRVRKSSRPRSLSANRTPLPRQSTTACRSSWSQHDYDRWLAAGDADRRA